MEHRRQFHHQVLRQRGHLRPVGDVGAHPQLHGGVRLAEAVVDPLVVDALVKVVFPVDGDVVNVRGGGDLAAVCGGGGDGTGVHQAHAGKLALGGLGALPVGEVPGGVPQGKAVVGGHVARAEAGAAEAGLDDGAALQQFGGGAGLHQLQADRHAGGIHVQGEVAAAAAAAPENVRRLLNVVEQAASAARDDALIGPDAAVVDLVGQLHMGFGIPGLGVGFHLCQDFSGVLLEFMDSPGVGGVEGHGDHGLGLGEVDLNVLIVPGVLAGMQLLEILRPLVGLVEATGHLVRLPDGGEAGGLRRHHVDAVAEVDG